MTLYDQLRRKIPLYDQLKSKASYRTQLNAAVRGLWLGVLNASEFEAQMQAAIDRGFRNAWKEGMEAVGLTFPDDMTAAEQAALFEAQAAEYGYIGGLAGAVMAGSKENGGKLSAFKVRIDLWVKRYLNIVNQAKLSVAADPVLEWGVHANESCTSCLKLNGQRRRSSVWREVLEVWPQHHDLECMQSADGPDVCQCTLNQTDKPPTRGRLPKWRVKHLAGSQFDHDQQTHGSGGGGGSSSGRFTSSDEWLKSLNETQKETLREWFGYSWWMRNAQRGSEDFMSDKRWAMLEEWAAIMETAPLYNGTVYRGSGGVPDETLGEWFESGGFALENDASATTIQDVAENFIIGGDNKILLVIEGESVDISTYAETELTSISREEDERVLRQGSEYGIVDAQYVYDDGTIFDWEAYYAGDTVSFPHNLPAGLEWVKAPGGGGKWVIKIRQVESP